MLCSEIRVSHNSALSKICVRGYEGRLIRCESLGRHLSVQCEPPSSGARAAARRELPPENWRHMTSQPRWDRVL